MAVKEMAVCDVCEAPAAQSVTLSITVNGGKRRNFTKDLCQKHLDEYLVQARPSRPGRPSKVYSGESPTKAPRRRRGRAPRTQETPARQPRTEMGEALELKELPNGSFAVAS